MFQQKQRWLALITGIQGQQKNKGALSVNVSKLYSLASNVVHEVIAQSQSAHVLHISQLIHPPHHSHNVHTHQALSLTLIFQSVQSAYIVCFVAQTGATGSDWALKINFHISLL